MLLLILNGFDMLKLGLINFTVTHVLLVCCLLLTVSTYYSKFIQLINNKLQFTVHINNKAKIKLNKNCKNKIILCLKLS